MDPDTDLEHLILANPRAKWNWAALTSNPQVRVEFVISHTELPWNTNWGIYENPNMTPHWIAKHPEFPMNWNAYSMNPSLTKTFLIDNLAEDWNWNRLSLNPAITPDVVEELMGDPRVFWKWGRFGLSGNPSMTYTFIRKHPEMPWDFYEISIKNPTTLPGRLPTEEDSQKRIVRRTKRLLKQLMRETWKPSRVYDWCLTEDEKEEMNDNV